MYRLIIKKRTLFGSFITLKEVSSRYPIAFTVDGFDCGVYPYVNDKTVLVLGEVPTNIDITEDHTGGVIIRIYNEVE